MRLGETRSNPSILKAAVAAAIARAKAKAQQDKKNNEEKVMAFFIASSPHAPDRQSTPDLA